MEKSKRERQRDRETEKERERERERNKGRRPEKSEKAERSPTSHLRPGHYYWLD
jgi:septal ring factor EnvC (AmiA/AmiB activator)